MLDKLSESVMKNIGLICLFVGVLFSQEINGEIVYEEEISFKEVLKDYTFIPSLNMYYHKDVNKKALKRVKHRTRKGKKISSRSSKYSKKAKLVDLSTHSWFFERGKQEFTIWVSAKATPHIIIIRKGLGKEKDQIAAGNIVLSKYTSAVRKKTKEAAPYWISFSRKHSKMD